MLPNEVIDRTDEVYPIVQTIIDQFITGCDEELDAAVIHKEIEIDQINYNEEASTSPDNPQTESSNWLLDNIISDSPKEESLADQHEVRIKYQPWLTKILCLPENWLTLS